MKLIGLQPEWVVFRDVRRDFIHGANCLPRLGVEQLDILNINGGDDDDDDDDLQ